MKNKLMAEREERTILVVYNYNRHDFLKYFDSSKGRVKLYFAEFTSLLEENNKVYQKYGTALYWGDFGDVFHLLETINPSKVLFHYIESNFHILLNAACILKSIPTYVIDHGIRDVNINIRLRSYLQPQPLSSRTSRFLTLCTQFIPRLKARLYFNRSMELLPAYYRQELQNIMQAKHREAESILKKPTAYIVISQKTFEYHKLADKVADEKRVHLMGIPSFDGLEKLKPESKFQNNIIFIDQGLATRRLFGWTDKKFKCFQSELINICKALNYTLLVKPHPRQSVTTWSSFTATGFIRVISDEQLKACLPTTQAILGFTSTYLLPLAALPHTALIILENHPAGRLMVSKSFIAAGVAHPVYSLHELSWALSNIKLLHRKQLPNKAKFTEEWLYRFDGKAGERLRNILLNNEL